jgi:hypothetical protein
MVAQLGVPVERNDMVIMHNEPGTSVALHPGTGSSLAAFIFRSPARIDRLHVAPGPGNDQRQCCDG